MLSRFTRASLCLGGAVAAACSDAPTAATPDTTTPPVSTTTNTCSGALSMSAGQVMAGVSGTSICVSGGVAGAEYALIPFYGTTLASATTTLDFTAGGTASPSAAPSLIPSASASFDRDGIVGRFADAISCIACVRDGVARSRARPASSAHRRRTRRAAARGSIVAGFVRRDSE